MKIVFLDTRTLGNVSNVNRFNDFGEVTLYPDTSPEQVLERIQEADVVISNKVRVSREVIEACSNLQLICVAATGMNNIDLEAAAERGIPVKNVKGYSSHSVAQVTFTLLLALLNSPTYYAEYVNSGEYSKEKIFTHLGRPFWELRGKRFGIIGLGDIGRQVARIAEAFGAVVVYFSASGNSQPVDYQRLQLDELLSTSDIISIHAPLNEQTKDLIAYPQIQLMKHSAILLNTSRGGIVNESDLAKAIDDNLIAGAGIDVFTQEPIPADHPYLQVKSKEKLLLTPHYAWSSIEARTLLVDKIYENIQAFFKSNGETEL